MKRNHYYTLLVSHKITWFVHKPSGEIDFYNSKLENLGGFPFNFRLVSMVLIRTFHVILSLSLFIHTHTQISYILIKVLFRVCGTGKVIRF